MIEIVIMFLGGFVIYQVVRLIAYKRYSYHLPMFPNRHVAQNKEKIHRVAMVILITCIILVAIVGGILGMVIESLLI